MEENHLGWKLMRGVRQDVINLFKRFSSTDSIRYEVFCEVWKQMNFSLIYYNRNSYIELLEFTEELLQIVKEYLLPVYEFHIRVAALYTLYGLYFKQPLRGSAKIRFTKSEWEEVYSLFSHCKAEKHYDAAFIHLKLYLNGAYTFTATVRPAGLERGFRKYFEKRFRTSSQSYNSELWYRPLISENLVTSLVKLESLYCKKKADLLGKNNIVFIDGKFATSLQEELKNYAFRKRQHTDGDKTTNNTTDEIEATSSESEEAVNTKVKSESSSSNKSKNKKKKNTEGNIGRLRPLKRPGTRYLEIIAKKKAEYYIQKLQEECNNDEKERGLKPTKFDLPEFDF